MHHLLPPELIKLLYRMPTGNSFLFPFSTSYTILLIYLALRRMMMFLNDIYRFKRWYRM